MDQLLAGNQMVLGIRSEKARIAESVFAAYTNLRFGVKDPLCGLKGYNLKYFSKTSLLKIGRVIE